MNERRREARTEVFGGFLFPAKKMKTFSVEGITVDVSRNGSSFYTFKPFMKGAGLRIRTLGIDSEYYFGTVRWCRKASPSFYQIGLSF
jgi:hypothetical protein